eukprot:9681490-Lingulodinium_polyedra.AAC.1
MQALRAVSFNSVPGSVRMYLLKIFSNFGSTALVGHSFQKARHAEGERPDHRLSALRSWATSVKGK